MGKNLTIVYVLTCLLGSGCIATVGQPVPTVRELFDRDSKATNALGPTRIQQTVRYEHESQRKTLLTSSTDMNDLAHQIQTMTVSGHAFKVWLNGNEAVLYDPVAKVYQRRRNVNSVAELQGKNEELRRSILQDESAKEDLARAIIEAITYEGKAAWKATWKDSTETNPDKASELVLICGKDDHLIYEYTQKTRRGFRIIINYDYRPLKRLPAERFRFVPPPSSREGNVSSFPS